MSAKDALMLALTAENQKMRKFLIPSLPAIVMDDESFSFKDDTQDFEFQLKRVDENITFAYSFDGREFLHWPPHWCSEVVFQSNRILFLQGDVWTLCQRIRSSYLERIRDDNDEPIARLLLKIEITDAGYSVIRIKECFDWLDSLHPIPRNQILSESPYEKILTTEHPLFHSIQLKRKLREFCARHHLLKEAS